jgi:hypothetical protein
VVSYVIDHVADVATPETTTGKSIEETRLAASRCTEMAAPPGSRTRLTIQLLVAPTGAQTMWPDAAQRPSRYPQHGKAKPSAAESK